MFDFLTSESIFVFSGLRRRVDWSILTDILDRLVAFIFRVNQYKENSSYTTSIFLQIVGK